MSSNEKHRQIFEKHLLNTSLKEGSRLKTTHGLHLYLKETSTHVFSCEYCEIF